MALIYEQTIMIDSRDVDGRNQCKASALMGHLQEAATQAAEAGGFGRDGLMQRCNAFWMITRQWFQINRPLEWAEELTIRTWHRGGKSAVMYRDYDILVGDELVGEGVSAWVLADWESRKLLRLGSIQELEGTSGEEHCKTKTLSKLRMPEDMAQSELRQMRYSDTDINGHVNNARYADFACDAVGMEQLDENQFLSSMQIGYLAECLPGEALSICQGEQDGGTYVRGLDESGKSRFEASLFFGKVLH